MFINVNYSNHSLQFMGVKQCEKLLHSNLHKMYSTETFSGKACQSSKHGDAWLSEKWWRERITKIYGHFSRLKSWYKAWYKPLEWDIMGYHGGHAVCTPIFVCLPMSFLMFGKTLSCFDARPRCSEQRVVLICDYWDILEYLYNRIVYICKKK
jgi:hypothetical protein